MRTGGGGYRNNTTLAAACMHEAVAMLIRIEAAPGFAGFADPDVADDSGVTPLHVASMFGLYDIVKFLLSYGRINVNVQDEGGRTPLHKAATGCRSKVVWLLLINGADPNARDSIGRTPLHSAVFLKPCVDVVKMLLEAGADPNVKDVYGRTPLHLAALHSDARLTALLLRRGADPNCNRDGEFIYICLRLSNTWKRGLKFALMQRRVATVM